MYRKIVSYIKLFCTRKKLDKISITYEDLLNDRPKYESFLFTKKKEDNFTNQEAYKYWDKNKNHPLNPENFHPKDNLWAWFICPDGKELVRNISWITNHKINAKEISVYNICPFLPKNGYLRGGSDCLLYCKYVTKKIDEELKNYILSGNSRTKISIDLLKYIYDNDKTSQMSFKTVIYFCKADDAGKKRFMKAFMRKNKYLHEQYEFCFKIAHGMNKLSDLNYLEEFVSYFPYFSRMYEYDSGLVNCFKEENASEIVSDFQRRMGFIAKKYPKFNEKMLKMSGGRITFTLSWIFDEEYLSNPKLIPNKLPKKIDLLKLYANFSKMDNNS